MELLSSHKPGFLGPWVPCNIYQGSLWLGATGLFQSFCISIPQQWQYDNSYHSISSVDLKTMKTFALDKISLEHSMDQHRQISIQPPQFQKSTESHSAALPPTSGRVHRQFHINCVVPCLPQWHHPPGLNHEQDFIGVFNGKFHPAAAIHNAPTPSCSSSPSNRKSPLLIASFPVHLSNIIFLDWTIIVRGHGLDIVEFWFFSWSAQHHQSRLTRP